MDRISPTLRPKREPTAKQQWRELLFLHWPVDPEVIQAMLPKGLTVDTFEGKAYVGIVPFSMKGVKPWWVPRFASFDFLETNVRTYVHHKGSDPGVFFFSLDAASWLAVQAARVGWSLPYHSARMSTSIQNGVVNYQAKRDSNQKAFLDVKYRVGERLGASVPGTLEHFLLERYLLYVYRNRALWCGQVHHSPYPAFEATVMDLNEGLLEAAGLPVQSEPPPLVHYSPEVDVEIFDLQLVSPSLLRLTT